MKKCTVHFSVCGSRFIRFHLELMRQHNVPQFIQSQVELVFSFSHLTVEVCQHFLSSITKRHELSCTCTAYYSFTQGCALEEYLLLKTGKHCSHTRQRRLQNILDHGCGINLDLVY